MSKATGSQPAPAVALSPIPTREQIIDDYGELDRQVKQFAPTLKRYEQLKDVIKSWYLAHPPAQPATAEGRLYTVQVSPQEMQATAKMTAIWNQLRKDRFLEICTIAQSALKRVLGEEKAAKFYTHAQTGPRKLTAVAKGAPAIEDAA